MTPTQDALLAAGAALLQAGGLLAVAPLLKTVIKKMKARLQNRQGPPLLQGYYDLAKLLRKEPVRSEMASWIYVAGPRVYFAAALAATTLVPGACSRRRRSKRLAESCCWSGRSRSVASRSPRPRSTPAVHSAAWARAAT